MLSAYLSLYSLKEYKTVQWKFWRYTDMFYKLYSIWYYVTLKTRVLFLITWMSKTDHLLLMNDICYFPMSSLMIMDECCERNGYHMPALIKLWNIFEVSNTVHVFTFMNFWYHQRQIDVCIPVPNRVIEWGYLVVRGCVKTAVWH